MHDLMETMEKLERVKNLKEKLLECFNSEVSTKGLECIDTQEAGAVVDMIKDLAEAEKCCMEALYYQKVTEAMTSYEEPRYGESYGYNRNRYANGRFSPKGSGRRMGYDDEPMDWEPQRKADSGNPGMMGYTPRSMRAEMYGVLP